jgi:hypothetical protein
MVGQRRLHQREAEDYQAVGGRRAEAVTRSRCRRQALQPNFEQEECGEGRLGSLRRQS